MARNNRLVLTLALLLCLSVPPRICDNGDGEGDGNADTNGGTPDADAEIIPSSPSTNDIDSLTGAKCMNKRKGCCDELHLDDEESVTKCFTLHQSKLPKDGENDPNKLFKFMSCFVECIYKQKKYIGKGDNINMKMVRADAAKMYADRPKEKDYHIKLFEFCRKDAANLYNMIKTNPAGKVLLNDTCKPFFMFVFLCQVEYHKKQTCPYFRWEGRRKTQAAVDCADAKNKCYEIDGITL